MGWYLENMVNNTFLSSISPPEWTYDVGQALKFDSEVQIEKAIYEMKLDISSLCMSDSDCYQPPEVKP